MKKGYTFSPRTMNALINGYYSRDLRKGDEGKKKGRRYDLRSLRDLEQFTREEIMSWRGVGKNAMKELDEAFEQHGLMFKEHPVDSIERNFLPLD